MANYYTVTGNLGGFMPPGTNLASLVVVVTTNLDGPVVDTAGNRVALGDVDVPVQANGDISVSLLQTDSADTNVSGWSYWLNVGYRTSIAKVDGRGATRDVARLGPFPLTADSTLAELSVHFDTPAVDPSWRDGLRTEMEAIRDESAANLAAQTDLSQIATPDALVAALASDPGSLTGSALASTIATSHGLYYANVYDGFFAGKDSAHDTSVPTIWANSTHLTDAGLALWADHIVALQKPGGGYVITGAAPKVVWIGDSWIDQGDDTPILNDAVKARIPGATVVVKGIGGQTSTQVLARFDTDVPADADFVIFNEPGVNDATINGGPENGLGAEGQLANLRAWVRKIHAIGAVPIWTGHVPLADWPRSAEYHQRLSAIVGDGARFPAAAPESSWSANVRTPLDADGAHTSIGYGPALDVAGVDLFAAGRRATAAGQGALAAMTTGDDNTAVGYRALGAATVDVSSTAVGSRALAVQRGDGQNTAIGANAGRGVTTGTVNTFIGLDAGYRDDAASTADAITTGTENTLIGIWAGTTSGDVYCATAIGNRTKVGYFSTAIGYGAKATHGGGVAIGADAAGVSAETAAANFIALGTANHTIHIVGKLRIDRNQTTVGAAGGASAVPATPVIYASVWAGDGTEYVIPLYAKA